MLAALMVATLGDTTVKQPASDRHTEARINWQAQLGSGERILGSLRDSRIGTDVVPPDASLSH
jgi:hypothetical protein